MTVNDSVTPSTNHQDNLTTGSPRSLKFLVTDLVDVFNHVDLAAAGKVLLLTVGALLIYDLLVYFLASTSSRKRMLVSPWLVQILATSWDDLGHRGAFARSYDAVGPVLKSLAHTAAKYESRWEKSRLL